MDNPNHMLTAKATVSCNPEIWGGIECTINRVKQHFFDQLEFSGHYDRPGDIDLLASTGIRKLRYPVLWEKHQPQKGQQIDWQWTEGRLNAIRDKGIDVIAGLVHHGSGPAFTHLLDKEFPYFLAQYAAEVARRFPWLEYYTPVNEPLTTARFSGLYGIWYPHNRDEESCMYMLINQCKGIVLSMQEIRKVNPSAKLVQTEDLGKTYSTPMLNYQARYENERRWLSYDLLCGRVKKGHPLWRRIMSLGIPESELAFFQENPCVPDVFGFNHYVTSERYIDERLHLYPTRTHGGNMRHQYADVEAVRVELSDETGIELLLKEAWERYGQPMALTEVHLHCHREEQLRWFKYVWDACNKVKEDGVNLVALTTWAMLGSYGWNKLLTQANGEYEPGAFDLRGEKPRATALAGFIRETASKNNCGHPLTLADGWWRRDTRYLHEPRQRNIRLIKEMETNPILIIGKRGTLGKAFARICGDRCLDYKVVGRDECDIGDLSSVENIIDQYKPWAIINAAGYVRVDDAEKDCDKCFRDNTTGPHNLALAAQKKGIRFISFSSDLVFDGSLSRPYVESDAVNPLNVYGRSKAQSEEIVLRENPGALVIRTSAFFGPWDEYNFIYYVRRSLSQYEPISVARDVIISPTYVPDLVHATLDLLVDGEKGIWHLANKGEMSWSGLAEEIADRYGLDRGLIQSLTKEEIGYPASRPSYSVLGSQRACILPSFEDALRRYREDERLFESSKATPHRA
jgi:dTDP-4-dehydrorhamnose reductase